jgi:DNA polymerase III subunit delta'
MIFERIAPEQYDSIPGIPEPAENPMLVGHSAAAQMLAGAYRTGRLPHALLFAGPQGIGKATLAFHLAHHLLRFPSAVEAPDNLASPEPSSPLFRQIATGAHPGVLHLTRPVNEKTKAFKTVLTVDEIRKVNRFLSLTSHDGSYRVVIVDPADDMNPNAANALLKNLEEPPSRTVFVLITHSIGRLLPTIRSRCQTILFQPLENGDLLAALEGLGASLPGSPAGRTLIAERAAGSPRSAILLTQYGGLEIAETIDRLVRSRAVNVSEAHRLADAVSSRDSGVQFEIFNQRVLDLVADEAATAARSGEKQRANRLSECWQAAAQTIADVETYNLDKKQHVVGLIHSLHSLMRT